MPDPIEPAAHQHRVVSGMRAKFILALLLTAVPIVAIIGALGLDATTTALRENVINSLPQLARAGAEELHGALARGRQDALFLAHSRDVRRLARECANGEMPSAQPAGDVEETFQTLANTVQRYSQIRYIDEAGMERVRIDYRPGQTLVMPPEALQDKSDRYYVQDALALGPGGAYTSRLDLNREHGEIEQPLRPVVRFAARVVEDGEPLGIVVLNLQAAPFLPGIPAPRMITFLTDEAGYYLHHPDAEKAWSGPYNLDTGHTALADFGDQGRALLAPASTVVETENELIGTWPVSIEGPSAESLIVVAVHAPSDPVFGGVREFRDYFWRVLAVSFGLPVLAGLILAAYFLRPLGKLHTAVHELAEGDLDVAVDVRSGDELQALAQDFNAMAARLREARDQERVALVGRMAETIIHDIKNPLTSIMAASHLMAEDDTTELQRQEMTGIVLSQVDRILAMLQELLDFSRDGESSLDLEPIELEELLAEIGAQVSAECDRRGVEFELDCPRPARVEGDRYRLERAILNIARNALDVMEDGGVLHVSCTVSDGRAYIAVSDTGPGLPPEIADRLFEPFVTRGKRSGTGLGLAITKSVAEAHGGGIAAENNPDRGATFTLALPLLGEGGPTEAGPKADSAVADAPAPD